MEIEPTGERPRLFNLCSLWPALVVHSYRALGKLDNTKVFCSCCGLNLKHSSPALSFLIKTLCVFSALFRRVRTRQKTFRWSWKTLGVAAGHSQHDLRNQGGMGLWPLWVCDHSSVFPASSREYHSFLPRYQIYQCSLRPLQSLFYYYVLSFLTIFLIEVFLLFMFIFRF